jgi:CheY-like chemotaxis protein
MPPPVTLLMVEDDADYAALLADWLQQSSPQPPHLVRVTRLDEALVRLAALKVDAILLDLNLPDSQRLATLREIVSGWPEIPVVVLTGEDEVLALAAVEAGAEDLLGKTSVTAPLLWQRLTLAMARHGRHRTLFARLASITRLLQGPPHE